jgi:hypothetical protein
MREENTGEKRNRKTKHRQRQKQGVTDSITAFHAVKSSSSHRSREPQTASLLPLLARSLSLFLSLSRLPSPHYSILHGSVSSYPAPACPLVFVQSPLVVGGPFPPPFVGSFFAIPITPLYLPLLAFCRHIVARVKRPLYPLHCLPRPSLVTGRPNSRSWPHAYAQWAGSQTS